MIRPDEAIQALELSIIEGCPCGGCEYDATVLAYIRYLEAENKRIQFDTAMKCAYLAWQSRLTTDKYGPANYGAERTVCHHYGINLDSLYATTWEELNK